MVKLEKVRIEGRNLKKLMFPPHCSTHLSYWGNAWWKSGLEKSVKSTYVAAIFMSQAAYEVHLIDTDCSNNSLVENNNKGGKNLNYSWHSYIAVSTQLK